MERTDERAVYEAPRVMESSKLRFETLISAPPSECTITGYELINGKWVEVCIE